MNYVHPIPELPLAFGNPLLIVDIPLKGLTHVRVLIYIVADGGLEARGSPAVWYYWQRSTFRNPRAGKRVAMETKVCMFVYGEIIIINLLLAVAWNL